MRPFQLRLSALACGLLLALPPGWCCLLLPCPVRAAAPAQTEATADEAQCPCCRHTVPQPQPPSDAAPPRCPQPTCCAAAPDAVKPSAPLADTALPAALPAADLSPCPAPTGPAAAVAPSPASTPLHVLHCVWLC
jgi:hypothetical protein